MQWLKVNAFPYTTIYDIEIEPDGRMLAVTSSALYYSDNNGVDWQTTAHIPKNYKSDLTIDAGGNYYVSTDGGVYVSDDRGVSWTEFNDGLPNLPYSAFIDCLELDKDNYLWAGSKITGLFRSKELVYTATGIATLTFSNEIPVQLDRLNHTLYISLSESEALRSSIRLFSISGACVSSLSVSQPFLNRQVLQLKDVQPGMYILNIESSEGRRSRKLVL